MNLIDDGIDTCAERVKMRLMASRRCVTVNVSHTVTVTVCDAARPGRRWPAETLVGLYAPGCPLAHIAEDLACRLAELRGSA